MRKMILFLKGILIGIALVLPGLSGSLMAVLLNLYETIVGWVSAFRKNLVNLIILGIGAAIGILISAKIVLSVCVRYPEQSNLFFLGLVAGGIPLLVGNVKEKCFTKSCVSVMILGFAGVFLLSLFSPAGGEFNTAITEIQGMKESFTLLLAGFISCGLMMLPGVSGSVLLILMGQYGTVYGAVSNLSSYHNWLRVLPICLLFGVGGLLGIYLISNLMRSALVRFASAVQWLILGLTSGTCGALAWVCVRQGMPMIVSVFWFVLGFFLTVLTTKLERRQDAV